MCRLARVCNHLTGDNDTRLKLCYTIPAYKVMGQAQPTSPCPLPSLLGGGQGELSYDNNTIHWRNNRLVHLFVWQST